MLRVYLAGPMATGTMPDGRDRIPARRLAAFDRAEAWLRAHAAMWLPTTIADKHRYAALMLYNPATVYRQFPTRPRALALRFDVRHLTGCDLLLLMPGWENSAGCSLEVHCAQACGIPAYTIARKTAGYRCDRLPEQRWSRA